MENDDFKDFTIKIGSMEFKAHKFVLVARSPTFANIIKENVHAEYLNLLDISADIFQLSIKFKNDQLRQKSFEKIKKILDFIEIDDNLPFEPGKLEELIEIKKKEQMMRKIEENVRNDLIQQ
ncbi:hypothetical protein PVAND_008582 [Polypedilum vanderplanki]|uniref:BTB domain-containing protein n=1 Tax=Polypedilum vanderplanki TaxID=319348 RepID=A0A9J6CAE9_POLVA|nr:hypothetical protein PVAND_008582 [Polypedilum vanderplanki]